MIQSDGNGRRCERTNPGGALMNILVDVLYYAALATAVLVAFAFAVLLNWDLWARVLLDRGRARLDEQHRQGLSNPHIGKLACVREAMDPGHLWVELDGGVWPAKLPPFTPTPPSGEAVRVINVVSNVLIVRPVGPGVPAGPSDPA